MARQLSEQLEREVSAEEILKAAGKPSNTADAAPAASTSSAPAAFDTSYMPNAAPSASPPPASAPAAVYSPEAAATVQGADWHASPPENTKNE
jgi:hypothetical protein